MNVDKDLGDQINGNPEENVGGPGGGGSASSVVDDFNGFNLFHRFLGDGGVTKGGLEYADKMSWRKNNLSYYYISISTIIF